MKKQTTREHVEAHSSPLDYRAKSIAIIMAAGHGKRIKSETPKVVHPVWGVPSIMRIMHAAQKGLKCDNLINVIGIKADDVVTMVGKHKRVAFAYQEEQKGTGHAVQVAVDLFKKRNYSGNVYIFPGDAGLIDARTIAEFKKAFDRSGTEMMLLTGTYEGPKGANYYGRVIRVPRADITGKTSGEDFGNAICILQHKDILSMKAKEEWVTIYRNRKYAFTKTDLLETREFDSGMFAFKADALVKYLYRIETNNVQGEIYLTDLVDMFNKANRTVRVFTAPDNDMLMGFNDKSTWKRMEAIARKRMFSILKNTVTIEDEERFFVAEEVIEQILRMDKRKGPLDIVLSADSHIGKEVKLNKGVQVGENVKITGNVVLGENVKLGSNIDISTYPNQHLVIGDNVEIMGRNIIKGNTSIEKNTRIETGVNITGSDEYPTTIGTHCLIKGTTYIFGSTIEPNNWIEHSILVQSYVETNTKKDGSIQKIRYYNPMPEGIDSIRAISHCEKK